MPVFLKVEQGFFQNQLRTKACFFLPAETFYLKTTDFHYPVNNTSSIIVVAVWPEILKAALHRTLENHRDNKPLIKTKQIYGVVFFCFIGCVLVFVRSFFGGQYYDKKTWLGGSRFCFF